MNNPYLHSYMHAHVCVRVCVRTGYRYSRTYTHTNTHIHTHTQTHPQLEAAAEAKAKLVQVRIYAFWKVCAQSVCRIIVLGRLRSRMCTHGTHFHSLIVSCWAHSERILKRRNLEPWCASVVCLICMPYMYALYVCLICMEPWWASVVCLICMLYMYALYVCLICMEPWWA